MTACVRRPLTIFDGTRALLLRGKRKEGRQNTIFYDVHDIHGPCPICPILLLFVVAPIRGEKVSHSDGYIGLFLDGGGGGVTYIYICLV